MVPFLKLNDNWHEGDTGIPPLDDAIKESKKFAYSHHINRLMIIANLMNLTGIHPNEMYRWFMEMYIDAYDWVMVPNVYGMGSLLMVEYFQLSHISVVQATCLGCQIIQKAIGAILLMAYIGDLLKKISSFLNLIQDLQ